MGGTFDPIHNGHLVCAEEALRQFELDEVVFIPAGRPWQKEGRCVASAEDRYLITMLATASNDRFSVSRIEIDREGPTYTIDTLRAFASFYEDRAELFFIMGADALSDFGSWKDPEAVLAHARIIAAARPGYDPWGSGADWLQERVSVIEIPHLAISSTDIRERISKGLSVRYLLPPEVAKLIEQRRLYA